MSRQPPILQILVVDDRAIHQMVILQTLQALGYRADSAMSGQEAIEAVQRSHYDIVLMNCRMPVLDGYSATRTIRQWERSLPQPRRIVIVALSADSTDNIQRAYRAEMDGHLAKPISVPALSELLDRWHQKLLSPVLPVPAIEPAADFPLDLNHLHQVCDYSPDFELELLRLFISDSQLHLSELQQAIAAQQSIHIEQAAHHIRGASANVGAKVMQTIAEQIEEQAYSQPPDSLKILMLKLQEALQPIQQFVDNRRNSGIA